MTAELRRGLVLAGVGVVGGFAIIVALFGPGEVLKRARSVVETAQAPRTLADLPGDRPPGGNSGEAASKVDRQATIDPGAALDPPKAPGAEEAVGAPKPGTAADAPSLDIIRVEPNGDSVIAGRSAPNASVEILRDNRPIARVTADPAGQFAITPPTLPAGNSEITFRSVAPDGKETTARESVVVVVAENRTSKPLVAVSTPDKPTQVLSQPEAPAEAKAGGSQGGSQAASQETRTADLGKVPSANPERKRDGGKPTQAETPPQVSALPDKGAKPTGGAASPVRIVSVDAQEGGRLDIAGRGTAWSTLRLYLNDTLVATGQAGPDGNIAFTIGRGVKAGGYQIRVDQVDAKSGKVEHRAQVAFAVPESAAAKLAANPPLQAKPPAQPSAPQAEARAAPPPMPAKPDAARKGVGDLAERTPHTRESRTAESAATTAAMPPPAPAAEERRTAARSGGEAAPTKLPTMAQAPPPPRADARGQGSAEGAEPAAGSAPKPTAPSPAAALPETSRRMTAETSSVAGAAKPGAAQPSAESDARTAQALAPKLPQASAPKLPQAAAAPGSPSSDTAEAMAPPLVADPATPAVLPPSGAGRLSDTTAPGTAASLTQLSPTDPAPSRPDKPGSVFVPEIATARISRGDNLWQISRKSYGNGFRYTVIFDANRDQIKDPDLIYPGQIFVLPKDEAGTKRG